MPRRDAARDPAAEPAPNEPDVDPAPHDAEPPRRGLPPGLAPWASRPSTSALVRLDVRAESGRVDAGVLARRSLYEMNERRLLAVLLTVDALGDGGRG